MEKKIISTGFIGLGAMGSHMASHLFRAGYLYKIWNRSPEKTLSIANQMAVNIADSPEQLAEDCQLIIICVSDDSSMLSVIKRIAVTIKPESIVIDTSTVSASAVIKATEILEKCNAHFLDCPVSGGVEGAKNASLAMMVGGDQLVLNKIRHVLEVIASDIVYIGDMGSGQKCKAVNQMMAAGINQAVTEALAFGEAMQLDMDKVVDVINSGAAANWFLKHRGKNMLLGKYQPGFKLSLHYKDLEICQDMLQDISALDSPVIQKTLVDYQRLMEQGFSNEDISALFRLKKQQLSKRP